MRPVTILVVGLVASGSTALLVYRAVQTRVVVQKAPAAPTPNLQVRPVVVTATERGSAAASVPMEVNTPVVALIVYIETSLEAAFAA